MGYVSLFPQSSLQPLHFDEVPTFLVLQLQRTERLEREYLSVGRTDIPEIYLLSRDLGRPPFVLNYIVAPGWVTQMMSFSEMSKT